MSGFGSLRCDQNCCECSIPSDHRNVLCLKILLRFVGTEILFSTRCQMFQVCIFAGALFIQLALGWDMYLSIVVLLLITCIYTVLGE